MPENQFLSINGLRLRCLEWGSRTAPSVVLLHGGSAHAHWWDLFAGSIADRYHVYTLDLRGHGDSDHSRPPAYGLEHYVSDLAAFLDAMALPSVTLIGHSLGAMIVTAYAGTAPPRIRSLVVVDSALKITPADARYMARLQQFPHPVYRSREDALGRFRLLPTPTTAAPSTLQHVAAQGLRELADGRWTLKFDRETMGQNRPRDLSTQLHAIGCPILIVRGAHSTVLTLAGVSALLQAAPHAEFVEIAAAHHHVMLDNPPEFARAVRTFLDRNSS